MSVRVPESAIAYALSITLSAIERHRDIVRQKIEECQRICEEKCNGNWQCLDECNEECGKRIAIELWREIIIERKTEELPEPFRTQIEQVLRLLDKFKKIIFDYLIARYWIIPLICAAIGIAVFSRGAAILALVVAFMTILSLAALGLLPFDP